MAPQSLPLYVTHGAGGAMAGGSSLVRLRLLTMGSASASIAVERSNNDEL